MGAYDTDDRATRRQCITLDGQYIETDSSSSRRSLRSIELTMYAIQQQNAELIKQNAEIIRLLTIQAGRASF